MKKNLVGLMMGAQLALAQAAAPPLQVLWDKALGGDGYDALRAVLPLADGGFLLAGDSNSQTGGNKEAPWYGGWDIWLVRLDAGGSKLWEQSCGGDNDDQLGSIVVLPDGGFAVLGLSYSPASGNKTSGLYGAWGSDWWLVRLDSQGNILWDRNYGMPNSGQPMPAAVCVTTDGGFALAGDAAGTGGTKTAPEYGRRDYWLVRVDGNGNKLWDKTYGGTDMDYLDDLVPAIDGGFLLCGQSLSGVGGNKTTPHCASDPLSRDVWLVRVDADGNKLGEQNLGRFSDDSLVSAVALPDGGFVVGLVPINSDGCGGTQGWGLDDYWTVRLDARGALVWDMSYGGTSGDRLSALQPDGNGGFWLGGNSDSPVGGNKTSPRLGTQDGWVVRIDGLGNKLWDRSIGTTNNDAVLGLYPVVNDRVLVLGATFVRHDQSPKVSGRLWAMEVSAQGDQLWKVDLAEEARFDRLYPLILFGRTPDGGFYAGGFPEYVSDYRLLKIGLPPTPAAQDQARLELLPEVMGEVQHEGFLLSLVGVRNTTYVTEYSTNLEDWTPFSTNFVGAVDVRIRDPGATNAPFRFYRARALE
jgi:hypothetical protein